VGNRSPDERKIPLLTHSRPFKPTPTTKVAAAGEAVVVAGAAARAPFLDNRRCERSSGKRNPICEKKGEGPLLSQRALRNSTEWQNSLFSLSLSFFLSFSLSCLSLPRSIFHTICPTMRKLSSMSKRKGAWAAAAAFGWRLKIWWSISMAKEVNEAAAPSPRSLAWGASEMRRQDK